MMGGPQWTGAIVATANQLSADDLVPINSGPVSVVTSLGALGEFLSVAPEAARVVDSGSTVTMTSADSALLINKTVGGATTVNLKTPALGLNVLIKDMKGDAGSNNITLDAGSGKLINGQQTLVMNANYSATLLIGMSATQWGTVV